MCHQKICYAPECIVIQNSKGLKDSSHQKKLLYTSNTRLEYLHYNF